MDTAVNVTFILDDGDIILIKEFWDDKTQPD